MRRTALVVMVSALALAGCGDSKLNPANWFHKRPADTGPAVLYTAPVDPRPLIARITSLKIDPIDGGVIVRATGLPPTQGWYNASLVALPDAGKGKLSFEFRITPPKSPQPEGTPASREVTVAASLTDYKLQDATIIEVRAATNTMSAHR